MLMRQRQSAMGDQKMTSSLLASCIVLGQSKHNKFTLTDTIKPRKVFFFPHSWTLRWRSSFFPSRFPFCSFRWYPQHNASHTWSNKIRWVKSQLYYLTAGALLTMVLGFNLLAMNGANVFYLIFFHVWIKSNNYMNRREHSSLYKVYYSYCFS